MKVSKKQAAAFAKIAEKHIEIIRKDPLSQVGALIADLEKQGDDVAIDCLYEIARWSMQSLQTLAAKNDLAAKGVISTLNRSINRLYEAQTENLEPYKNLARNTLQWPGFVTVDNDWKKHNEQLVEHLKLGADSGIKPRSKKGRSWSRETTETHVALQLILLLKRHNKNLPPLNKNTCLKWWEAGKPIFLRIYGEKFEEHRLFVGKYGSKKHTEGTLAFEIWVRKQIQDKMTQAFKSIARAV